MNYYCLNNPDVCSEILTWWNSLEYDSGLRAELRRAESPSDVILTDGFRVFFKKMQETKWARNDYIIALAAVAGVLSIVKENDSSKLFAEQCAQGSEHPVVSEMRFSALQKSRNIDELFTRMRRIIHQLGETANILSVVDDIFHWYEEMVLHNEDNDVRNTIRMRWGMDYFLNAENK